ncbi:hypothetical protein ANAEL_05664 [Anaerolineales bacterium]|nr:hypothetical protein ANAEL_05664 [Anaerolineales bacterium]
MPAAIATFSIHAIVTAPANHFSKHVASNCIGAMIFRLVTWLIFLTLVTVQSRRQVTQ